MLAGVDDAKERILAGLDRMKKGLQEQLRGIADIEDVVKNTDLSKLGDLLRAVNTHDFLQKAPPVQPRDPEPGTSGSQAELEEPSYVKGAEKAKVKAVTIDKKKKYMCTKCGVTKGSYGGVLSHINSEHLKVTYKCPDCQWETHNPDSFNKHREEGCGKGKGKGKGKGSKSPPAKRAKKQ